jgi:hypothetical protein
VQHERVYIRAQLGDDERNTLSHQAGYEGHVARQSVELGYYDRTFAGAASGQRCGQLRTTVEGICALPVSISTNSATSSKPSTEVDCAR